MIGLQIKTIAELHEMTVEEIDTYKNNIYTHCLDISAIRDYKKRIGEPKMLAEPEVAEFEEE
tara:strand:+ start:355 stop:540 length:186 start_codon:yes stop_codon:yes gene_type:complete